MRTSTWFDKVLGSGLSLAAVLGTTLLCQAQARACSAPDTGTKAGKTFPFVTDDNPYYWDGSAGVPMGGDGSGGTSPAPADPRAPNDRQPLLIRFGAGNDRDSDPNRDYFNHPHHAYTLVTLSDATTGAVVRTDKVPVWDYGAIDRGTLRKGDTFRRIEALRIESLPAGQYRVQTQSMFLHPDGNNANWGGSPLEGAPAAATFVIDHSPAATPAAGTAVVGEGCHAAPGGHAQLGWLGLAGLLVIARTARRHRTTDSRTPQP